MKIDVFTRPALQVLRASLVEALKPVAETHGLSIVVGKVSFMTNNCTVRIEVGTVDASGVVHSREAEDFKVNAALHGLTPEHLGRTFMDRGAEFKLVGYRVRARTKPFVIADASGHKYVASESLVLRGFGLPPRRIASQRADVS
jgi:hypothetical protein